MRSLGVWLTCLALCAHFVQAVHFLAVPHVVGAHGELCHVVPEAHRGDTGCGADESQEDSSDEDGERDAHRCNLHPPFLEPCGDAVAQTASAQLVLVAVQRLRSHVVEGTLPPLTLAPKHSPPIGCA